MLTRFKNKYKSLFLDPLREVESLEDAKINIILSPSLYWVKKVSLPVKNTREAMRLLPSLFEDTLPEGKYSYYAYKDKNHFFIFAYEDKVILDVLLNKNIPLANVMGMYFAQSEFHDLQNALRVNETQSMYMKDEVLLLVPSAWASVQTDIDFDGLHLSNYSITLKQFGHIVDTKSLYRAASLLLLLCFLLGVELFITAQKTAQITQAQEGLFAQYNLKSTMMQNSSMLKKYSSMHTKQTKLREVMGTILALKLEPSHELLELKLKNGVFFAEFGGVLQTQERYIAEALKAKNLDFKGSFRETSWYVEIGL